MASSASDETGGRPVVLAAAFCSSMAWRTAWSPPRSSCSATGICSGRSDAEHGVAVHGGRRRRRPLAPRRPAVTLTGAWPAGPGSRAALALPTLGTASALGPLAPPVPVGAVSPGATRTAAPRAPLTVVVTAPRRARREYHGHVGSALGRPLDLDTALGLLGRACRLGGRQGEDLDPLETRPRHRPATPRRRPARSVPERRQRCPWAGAPPRRATSTTRPSPCSSARCRSGVTCGGHATSPSDRSPAGREERRARPPQASRNMAKRPRAVPDRPGAPPPAHRACAPARPREEDGHERGQQRGQRRAWNLAGRPGGRGGSRAGPRRPRRGGLRVRPRTPVRFPSGRTGDTAHAGGAHLGTFPGRGSADLPCAGTEPHAGGRDHALDRPHARGRDDAGPVRVPPTTGGPDPPVGRRPDVDGTDAGGARGSRSPSWPHWSAPVSAPA